MRRRLTALTIWVTVLAGMGGAAVAMYSRGGEDPFRYKESRSLGLRPATVVAARGVEVVVAKAPEPVLAAKRTPPALVRCRPGGVGVLRNPWSCTIRYRSGTRAHYRVVVSPNGHYRGVGSGIIEGCCVKTPTLD